MNRFDFKTIVPAAQAGDKAARDKLMAEFYAWSIVQATRTLRNREDAENVAVSFWEWLYTKNGIDQFDPAKGPFYPWMAMRIRYQAFDSLKKKKVRLVYGSVVNDPACFDPIPDAYTPEELPKGSSSSPDPLAQLIARQELESVASKLRSPTQKEVFWRMIDGATPQDIAEELGLSLSRIRNVMGEVRVLIRATLGE